MNLTRKIKKLTKKNQKKLKKLYGNVPLTFIDEAQTWFPAWQGTEDVDVLPIYGLTKVEK